MTRTDRLTLVRQLKEEGLSQRAIAKRLKVSKDTVRRDLERLASMDEPDDAPPAAPDDQDAPQVSTVDAGGSAPTGAPQGAPLAQLPRRSDVDRLDIDLRRRPGLRRDLAYLAQIGSTPEELVATAVRVLAVGHRTAVAAGDIEPGRPFNITGLSVAALPVPGPRVPSARTTPAAPVEAG
ncbi:HTH domain-containing protein [Streptomyces phaeochromogenes]